MKAKLIFEGREHEIEITEEFALEVTKALPVEKKKTGYERVESGKIYYRADSLGIVKKDSDIRFHYDEDCYNTANYYADKTVAENNARADKLYRQLRRFAVEHRETELDWKEIKQKKFAIVFGHEAMDFFVRDAFIVKPFGGIYFTSEETAQLAVNTFKNELLWYFTEYKDSL